MHSDEFLAMVNKKELLKTVDIVTLTIKSGYITLPEAEKLYSLTSQEVQLVKEKLKQ